MENQKKIDIQITFSDMALMQLALIKENDFTLEGQVFRLRISGKGCTGFDYEIGFTAPDKDDITYHYKGADLSLDPFTAYYAQTGHLDYQIIHEEQAEGFLFINENERTYRGKFFKNTQLLPPGA